MKIALTVSKTAAIGICSLFALVLPHSSFASEANYGAGFWPSPSDIKMESSGSLHATQDNYGAGFTGSPSVIQSSISGQHISQSNYGAGFTGSPTVIHTFTFRPQVANYGAGFRTYGAPFAWSGAPYRIYSFGWWF